MSALVSLGGACFAGTITGTVSCTGFNQPQIVASPGSCSFIAGWSSASSTVSESSVNGTVNATVSVAAQGYQTAVASAAIEDMLLISSPGPVTAGWLSVTTLRNVSQSGPDASADSGFISGQTTITNQNSNYMMFFEKVTLGLLIEVQIYADATSACFAPFYLCDFNFAQATSFVQLQLFQGNFPNITPVDTFIVDSPEPPTFELYGWGMALAAMRRRRKRSIRLAPQLP